MKHLSNGVEIFIRTRDEHPPPHVHIEHQAERWEFKVEFSYIENDPSTYKVTPLMGKLPSRARLNTILMEVMNSRGECRNVWWSCFQNAGLGNKTVAVNNGLASPASSIVLGSFLVLTAEYDDVKGSMLLNGNIIGKCP